MHLDGHRISLSPCRLAMLSTVVMRMIMIVIRPVLMLVAVRRAGRRQLLGRVGVPANKMMRVIMAKPAILGRKVGDERALAMSPAAFVDIKVAFPFGGALLLGQAVPFLGRVFTQHRR